MVPETLHVVIAFVQPFQLEAVVDALRELPDFPGMSVSEVRGFGRHLAHPPRRGERTEVEPFEQRLRLEIFCRASASSGIMNTIQRAAHTGNQGDGKIFAADVSWALHIGTGAVGMEALLGADDGRP